MGKNYYRYRTTPEAFLLLLSVSTPISLAIYPQNI